MCVGIGLVLIPIDGVRSVTALGELGSMICFPPFAVAVLLAVYAGIFSEGWSVKGVLSIAAVTIGVITVSALVNFPAMQSNVFHERYGLMKFATCLLVIVFGFALAGTVEFLPLDRSARVAAPCIAASAFACILFSVFELAAKHGFSPAAYQFINHLAHSGESEINAWNGAPNLKVIGGWDPRLRSLSFEPPAFGNFTGFAWPWLMYGAMTTRRAARAAYMVLLALFTSLIIISFARTGLVMLAFNVAIAASLRLVYFTRSRSVLIALARLAIPAGAATALTLTGLYFAVNYDTIISHFVSGASVSNLSRSASQIAGFRMFLDHPLLGVGLGQFAFNMANYLPTWGFSSSEILRTLSYSAAPWPATYSVFARLSGEIGIFGVLGWSLLWVGLFSRLVRARRSEVHLDSRVRDLAYPLAMNSLGVLVSGIATDTLRTPMIWIALGLSCAYLREARENRAALALALGVWRPSPDGVIPHQPLEV
jgi:hypothetical protein